MNNLILVLKGGIGNQLFIVALGILLKSKGFSVRYDVVSGFYRDFRYSRKLAVKNLILKNELFCCGSKWPTLIRYYIARFLKIGPRYTRSDTLQPIETIFQDLSLEGNYLEGYWFDASFILTNSANIIYESIKQEFSFIDIATDPHTAVHLRIYDDLDCLSEVRDFLSHHESIFKNSHAWPNRLVRIFSNSNVAANILKSILEKEMNLKAEFIQGLDHIDDMRLACRHRFFIGSASTYSWWIAFIVKKAGGNVALPKVNISHELYEWSPNLLIPESW